jgi:hypothetical protein
MNSRSRAKIPMLLQFVKEGVETALGMKQPAVRQVSAPL